MTIDRKVQEVPLETATVSVLQSSFPREVLKEPEAKGCVVKERSEGIFGISGVRAFFPSG